MILFECECDFALLENGRKKNDETECIVRIEDEAFSISPKFGEPFYFSYHDIYKFKSADFKIIIDLTSDVSFILSKLGYYFDDFLRFFSKKINETILKELLINETIRKSGIKANFIYYTKTNEVLEGLCELRLYDTSLVVIPECGEIIRVLFSEIQEISVEDYSVLVVREDGERLSLSKMGWEFDNFIKVFSEVYNARQLEVQTYLKELLPEAHPLTIREIASFMKEGKAVRRIDIDMISPDLWKELERRIGLLGIKKEYDFLSKIARREKVCIGVKRGLLGELTGEYIWFLIPIYGDETRSYGNAIAMEASSEKDSGKATYFFRIVGRKEYHGLTFEELDTRVDDLINQINRCMLEINFRREPIYLPREKIEKPEYEHYKFAIQKISALRTLRKLFIGRIVHRSYEQWMEDVMHLLKFNVSIKDDDKKWFRRLES